ncbi:arginine--tRNA ligase [Candidatus Gribaldobacteria bacterium]|nr:arginine--tRNA ligase [Candidatus Gribaldobacteria bacterium]
MLQIEEKIKNELIKTAYQSFKVKLSLEKIDLKFPPNVELGDFCFEAFELAKKTGKNANEIAKIIAQNYELDILERAETRGPYLNFKVKNEIIFQEVLKSIEKQGLVEKAKRKEKIMIEYLSPNTNKPLHLGHLRNGALGMALSNILTTAGNKVIKANLINDRGVHISKSMLAYQKWGQNETPEIAKLKGDHFVGKYYVKYALEEEKNPELKNEIQVMLKKWEENDKETRALWQKMNTWVYQGFEKTYQDFGLKFDVFFYESQTYLLGKEIVEQGLKKGIFKKENNGSVVAVLPEKDFGLDKDKTPNKKVLLRADGTSVYTTQDLGAAIEKFKKYKLNKSIYVVGNEQDYHFKCLFEILKQLGFNFANECYHLSYGMVYLPEGKMKSREGKVVDADNLMSEIEKMALLEIEKRDCENKISKQEAKNRAYKIALGAIKFYLLLPNPQSDVHFDPKQSLSLDGKTGPYCQYAFARLKSILRKAGGKGQGVNGKIKQVDFSLLKENEELLLLQNLLKIKIACQEAAKEFNPSKLAQGVYDLSACFNQFYQKLPVLDKNKPEITKARLKLIEATSKALKQGLNLLGIETLDEM